MSDFHKPTYQPKIAPIFLCLIFQIVKLSVYFQTKLILGWQETQYFLWLELEKILVCELIALIFSSWNPTKILDLGKPKTTNP